MWRPVTFLVLILCLLPMAGMARLTQLNVGTVTLDVGAICAVQMDETIPAPATEDGQVGVQYEPYRFVMTGDSVPSLPDIAVGMVVRLRDFQPGETITLQAGLVEIGVTPDTWRTNINDDGSFWVATSPDPGTRLQTGNYRFSAFRGRQAIIVYDIWVRSATLAEVDGELCAPATRGVAPVSGLVGHPLSRAMRESG